LTVLVQAAISALNASQNEASASRPNSDPGKWSSFSNPLRRSSYSVAIDAYGGKKPGTPQILVRPAKNSVTGLMLRSYRKLKTDIGRSLSAGQTNRTVPFTSFPE